MIEGFNKRRIELNYRKIILDTIKRSASGAGRVYSWSRKSKRYGVYAPGKKDDKLPILHFFVDTSGSISVEEVNDQFTIIDEFLGNGHRECILHLFHTEVYKQMPYVKGYRLASIPFQSGGTNLYGVFKAILDKNPDLSIVLTDGQYGDVPVERMLKIGQTVPMVLFIITKQGTRNHPLLRIGKTIQIPQ